jgi:hypothetical protein
VSLSFIVLPVAVVLAQAGWIGVDIFTDAQPAWLFDTGFGIPILVLAGLLLLTSLMHLARGIGRLHAMFAKTMLVARTASSVPDAAQSGAALPAH